MAQFRAASLKHRCGCFGRVRRQFTARPLCQFHRALLDCVKPLANAAHRRSRNIASNLAKRSSTSLAIGRPIVLSRSSAKANLSPRLAFSTSFRQAAVMSPGSMARNSSTRIRWTRRNLANNHGFSQVVESGSMSARTRSMISIRKSSSFSLAINESPRSR